MDRMKIQSDESLPYVPVRGDELDEEFARVVNESPVSMPIRRLDKGKYYFGGRVDDHGSSLVGGKTVLCRLMEYGRVGVEDDSGVSSGGGTDDGIHPQPSHARSLRRNPSQDPSKKRRKVLVRVGGGWQDLDIFLLDHGRGY